MLSSDRTAQESPGFTLPDELFHRKSGSSRSTSSELLLALPGRYLSEVLGPTLGYPGGTILSNFNTPFLHSYAGFQILRLMALRATWKAESGKLLITGCRKWWGRGLVEGSRGGSRVPSGYLPWCTPLRYTLLVGGALTRTCPGPAMYRPVPAPYTSTDCSDMLSLTEVLDS